MHGPDIRSNGHLIVVENNHQLAPLVADMVQRLKGHAARQRTIADHGDHLVVLTLEVARHRHAHRGGE
ncbi:hypothetical protein D3C73_1437560 [compost metagenome]